MWTTIKAVIGVVAKATASFLLQYFKDREAERTRDEAAVAKAKVEANAQINEEIANIRKLRDKLDRSAADGKLHDRYGE